MVRRNYNNYYNNPTYNPNNPGQNPYAPNNPNHGYHYNINPQGQGYAMDGYPPPPPAYHQGEGPPPVYVPPQGGSKIAADQGYARPQMETGGPGGESSHTAPFRQ